MTACIVCGNECPPRRPGHNGGGRPRVMCGSVECKRAYNRAARVESYRRLRELNARGVYAKWQHKTVKPRGEHHAAE